MKQALDKYGIAMPAFGKIGGLLAGEVLYTLKYATFLEQIFAVAVSFPVSNSISYEV